MNADPVAQFRDALCTHERHEGPCPKLVFFADALQRSCVYDLEAAHAVDSPLFVWATRLCMPLLRLLLKHGCDPNHRGNSPYTPLAIAANRHNHEGIFALISHGVDVNAPCVGFSPLMFVVIGETNVFTEAQRICIDMLCRAGADINAVCTDHTFLALCCAKNDITFAKEALRRGASVELFDFDQQPDLAATRDAAIASLGGDEGVAAAHTEWLLSLPGRHTKRAS